MNIKEKIIDNMYRLKEPIYIKYNNFEFILTKKQTSVLSGYIAYLLILQSVFYFETNFLYFLIVNMDAFLILLPISYYNKDV